MEKQIDLGEKQFTFNQTVKMLNGLCEGLGDAFNDNYDNIYRGAYKSESYKLHEWIIKSFEWSQSFEGFANWCDIFHLVYEIELGLGRTKNIKK